MKDFSWVRYLVFIFVLCLSGRCFLCGKVRRQLRGAGKDRYFKRPDIHDRCRHGDPEGQKPLSQLFPLRYRTGETALFTDTGATGSIRNVIGRITGGSPSSIDGGIASTIPGANLFLMNPYGFMFGPNAWINVPGSFHVTTADYLKMADGAKFYADLGKTSVLSTEPVSAFGFLTSTPAPISVEGSKLFGDPLSTISFIGGNIEIKNDPGQPYSRRRCLDSSPRVDRSTW